VNNQRNDINKIPLTRIGLIGLVSSLVISGIVAIVIFLVGDFGEIQQKTLATTVSLAGFSILSLPSLWHLERTQHGLLSRVGLLSSLSSFIMIQLIVWVEPVSNDEFGKSMITLYIIAFATNHALLMMIIKSGHTLVLACKNTTICIIFIVGSAIIAFMWIGEPPDIILRLFGTLVVLDVLGTIVTPMLSRLLKNETYPSVKN